MKKFFTVLLAALCSLSVWAHDFKVGTVYYKILADDKVEVTYRGAYYESYANEYYGSIIIPEAVTYDGKTYAVTSIGNCTFFNCSSLTSITIPNSVTSIGSSAFSGCSGLTSITIPNTVKSVGSSAFYNCSGLTSVIIGNSVKSIESYTFQYCSSLTSITIPNIVKSIGFAAFHGCTGLTSIIIPNSVKSIGTFAFNDCSGLTSITIPNSVTSIDASTFSGCSSLTKTNYTGDIAGWCNIKFGDCFANPMYYSQNLYINGEEIKDLVIPNSVESIHDYTFYGCSSLTSITIPNSVMSIGSSAFSGCDGLTSIAIPNSVTSIGSSAFYNCSGLTSVIIGNSVKSIESYTFQYCSSLTSITIPNSVTSIEKEAFYGCSGMTSVTIGNSVTSIGEKAFYGCTSNKVILNNSALDIVKGKTTYGYVAYYATEIYKETETIGDFVFAKIDGKDYAVAYVGNDCQITLPADYHGSSYGIGTYLFYKNQIANSINISNAVTSIGDHAFNGCSKLNVVYIGNSVISIGTSAFYNCPNLYKVIMLPNSVPTGITSAFQSLSGRITYVGNTNYQSGYDVLGAQRVYTNLNSYFSVDGIVYALVNPSQRTCDIIDCDYSGATTEFSIGNTVVYKKVTLTVDSININAFRNNSKMTKMVIDCNHSLPSHMASGSSSIDTLIITKNVVNIDQYAFQNCSGLENVTIENNGKIGLRAFEGSSTGNPATYIISNVGIIEESAFANCTKMQNLTVNPDVTTISQYAFQNCSGLENVTIENNGKIGLRAFEGSSTGNPATYIISNVGIIEESAFANCSAMKNLTVNSNVTSIGQYAFQNCSSLENVTIKNSGTIGMSTFESSSTGNPATYVISNIGLIEESAFANCSAMKNLTVNSSVTTIGQYAFQNCSGLENVTIKNNGMIGASAFESSSTGNPATYVISNIGLIDESAFANCTAMKDLKVDSCVGNIGQYAFQNCSALENVTIKNNGMIGASAFESSSTGNPATYVISNIGLIDESAFANCTAMKDLKVDSCVGNIGQYAFQNCSALENVTIKNNGMIGASAFESSSTANIATYNISNVGSIGKSAFANCTKLQKVHLGNQVGDINQGAFYNCVVLDSLILPNTVTALGNNTFYNCKKLAYIQLSNSLSTIGDAAFDCCYSLPEIFIPKSISSIGQGAFNQCTALSILGFEDGKNPLSLGRNSANKGLFYDCPLDSVYIGRELSYQNTEAYGYSPFYRSPTLRSIVISDVPSKIETNEFYGCTNLYYVLIGNGAQSIGDYAFSGCSAIDYFRFGSQVKTIGAEAFSDCVAMTRLYTYCQQPPICGASALEDIDKWSCTLYIPDGTLAAYIAADQWKDFFFVEENNLKFTITWKNEDGSIFDQTEVSYGLIPTHAAPVKPSTELYSYTFAGWTPEVVAATSDATYTATYTSELRKYTVTFLDEDGTTLSSQEWEYGTTPTCDDPTKPATEQYTYTFAGWTPEVVAVTGDATYTATYTAELRKYTVTFLDEDGSTLSSEEWEYGTTPTCEDPTKPSTEQYTYTFAGWSPEVVLVSGNATYTATYTSTLRQYTITFLDEDGTILSSQAWDYGTMPTCVEPTKPDTEQYTYTFAGWSPEVVPVTGNATYTATYTSDLRKYTITFLDEDGTKLSAQDWEYGTMPTCAEPTKPDTEQYTYTFADWTPEVVAVTGNATYTATYTSELRKYTITFLDEDGTTLSAQDWEYGTMPTCDEPIKPADAQYTYTFAGWTPTIVAVTADVTYIATYNKTVNKYTITATAENGTVQGTGEYDYGTVVELMAIADTGYKFDKWSDEVTDNPRMVTVTENMEFTALFISDVGASIEDIHATSNKVQKVLIDGILYILRDGKTYNTMGQEM